MKDIAFHLTDIAENSIRAGAHRIGIDLRLDGNSLTATITDDGCGMDATTLERVTNPFYTTRTTRRIGLGIPLLIQSAEQCGGTVEIRSSPGKGTEVTARFCLDHIDCPPAGNLADTFMLLMAGNPANDIRLTFAAGDRQFALSTEDVLGTLDGIPIGHPRVASLLREIIRSGLEQTFGNCLR